MAVIVLDPAPAMAGLFARAALASRRRTRCGADPWAARWWVPADTGRRYAKVFGDMSPIHLCGLIAEAFAFGRAIAHAMWTQARVLAALSGRLPDTFSVDVAFPKPMFLPSTVFLSTAPADGAWDVAVRSANGDVEHLVGTVRPG